GAVCVSPREVGLSFQGSGAAAYQASRALAYSRADCRVESGFAGLGRVLQARPRSKTLPPARRLGPTTYLVASVQTLAQRRLATAAERQAIRRVWACQPGWTNSFDCTRSQAVFVKAAYGKTVRAV